MCSLFLSHAESFVVLGLVSPSRVFLPCAHTQPKHIVPMFVRYLLPYRKRIIPKLRAHRFEFCVPLCVCVCVVP
jgi:hypothetical protein